jgi:hypothetical protein
MTKILTPFFATRPLKAQYLLSVLIVLVLLLVTGFDPSPAGASEIDNDGVQATQAISEESAGEDLTADDPRGIRTEALEPIVNLQYKVMFWNGEWLATLTGQIDEYVQHRPLNVQVGVPAGTEVFWFGEIDEDNAVIQEFAQPWQVHTEGDFDIYTAQLSRGTGIQLDLVTSDPRIEVAEGPGVRVSYTPFHDVEELWLAAATPPGTAVLDRNIQYLGTGPNGELAFAYVLNDAAGGQEHSVDIIYATGITETVSNISPAVPIGIVVSMLVLTIGGVWYYRKNAHSE